VALKASAIPSDLPNGKLLRPQMPPPDFYAQKIFFPQKTHFEIWKENFLAKDMCDNDAITTNQLRIET
jgi:hypothetical protein